MQTYQSQLSILCFHNYQVMKEACTFAVSITTTPTPVNTLCQLHYRKIKSLTSVN